MTIGIDPGFRTGCKVAVVDGTGKFLAHATIYPTPPKSDTAGAARTLQQLIEKYDAKLIAIGNGTASRETDAFVTDVDSNGSISRSRKWWSVNRALRSTRPVKRRRANIPIWMCRCAVPSASLIDCRIRLAELVKIDPKSIGVGQYQHDVNQTQLRKCLDREVESCVNSVGVDLNIASAPLLVPCRRNRPQTGREHCDASRRARPFRQSRSIAQGAQAGTQSL